MRRDPELIRLLMLRLEGWEKPSTAIYSMPYSKLSPEEGYSEDEVHYHVSQILQNGWVDTAGAPWHMSVSGTFTFAGLTPSGHDFVDSVRDEEVWRLTKNGLKGIGSYTLQTLATLAKGYMKQKVEKLTGISMGGE